MFVIEFSAPAGMNIVSKEEEKRTKYQELLGQLHRLWPDYAVSLLVMVTGSLGGMRNTLLSALRAMPVRCTAIRGPSDCSPHDDSDRVPSQVLCELCDALDHTHLSSLLLENFQIRASSSVVDIYHQKLSLWRGVTANNSPVIRIEPTLAFQTTHNVILGLRPSGARARKYFSPSNLLTLYKAQIRPSLEYCSHIWRAAAPTILSVLNGVQRRAIRLIGDPALTFSPVRCAVGDLSLFYRCSNGFCSSKLTSIIPSLSKPARYTCRTCSCHPKAVVLHTSRNE
nr:unnamed protein product [Callosobruchus chinensis]